MSYNMWIAKQTVVQIYHGILLNNKKEQTVDTYNLNGSQENYVDGENNNLIWSYTVWFYLYILKVMRLQK